MRIYYMLFTCHADVFYSLACFEDTVMGSLKSITPGYNTEAKFFILHMTQYFCRETIIFFFFIEPRMLGFLNRRFQLILSTPLCDVP